MALPESKLDICNLALNRIGAKVVTQAELTADTAVTAMHCNRNYEQTRDALLRSNQWRFARERASLVKGSDPPFEYDHSYKLPDDYLSLIYIYDSDEYDGVHRDQYALEGDKILSSENSLDIKYIRRVTDVAEFDALFIEVFVLALALKLVMPLSQDRKLYAEIKEELYKKVMPKVRAVDRQETSTKGRGGRQTWNEARY
jgi:hypothetical protein